ncbi:MAG: winged helix-turn-helix domain-containing protein [Promethearchaeota archaeon]
MAENKKVEDINDNKNNSNVQHLHDNYKGISDVYKDTDDNFPNDIVESLIITNPDTIKLLLHKRNQQIIELLYVHEKNIIEMKNELKLNPGTIKRHLDALLKANLIYLSNIVVNEYGIRMKYYRVRAKKFIIQLDEGIFNFNGCIEFKHISKMPN